MWVNLRDRVRSTSFGAITITLLKYYDKKFCIIIDIYIEKKSD